MFIIKKRNKRKGEIEMKRMSKREKTIIEKNLPNSGITLIALVITVIVLLILASISIATLTGDNGLIKKANEAKQATIIEHEKEAIDLAYIHCQQNSSVTAENLQAEMIRNEDKVNVTNSGNNLIVTFDETGHEYTVLPTGEVKEGKIEGEESDNTETIVKMINNDNGTPINGGTISIYSDEGCSICVMKELLIQNLEGERIELEPGTYYVEVNSVPTGYKVEDNNVLKFSVIANQSNIWEIKLSLGSLLPSSGGPYTVTMLENGIEIKIQYDELLIRGMSINCYYVGYQSSKDSFTLEGDFEEYPVDLTDITEINALEKAKQLASYAEEDNLPPLVSGQTNNDGQAIFGNLDAGLYLFTFGTLQIDGKIYSPDPILIALE